ncbi:MAG TPA: GntR family transcriptional regulator [Solirubrobacteraceae bacterium]|jgi:DNA-binding transcriptional regulator YhcF (GntR family)
MGQTAIDIDTVATDVLEEIALDRRAEVPIGAQLGWAIAARIADGRLVSGQRLPGLREVADALAVNVNTVRAAYQRLESDGLIVIEQGRGTFVGTAHATRPSGAGKIAAWAANEARESGVDPREVAAALYVSQPPVTGTVDEALERRRLLRAQIGVLERTLGELEAARPDLLRSLADVPKRPVRRSHGPSLLDVQGLEQVRAELLRRLTAMQTAIDTAPEPETRQRKPAQRKSRAQQTQARATPPPKPSDTPPAAVVQRRKRKGAGPARPAPAGA